MTTHIREKINKRLYRNIPISSNVMMYTANLHIKIYVLNQFSKHRLGAEIL